jgi:hypothetical protein
MRKDSGLGARVHNDRDSFRGIEAAESILHDKFLPDDRLAEVCWSKVMRKSKKVRVQSRQMNLQGCREYDTKSTLREKVKA